MGQTARVKIPFLSRQDEPLDPTLVAPWQAAARPELTGGRRIGVAVIHGFTGSPASMRPWAEHLAEQGYAVSMPLLPGHGTVWRDLNSTTWADWSAAVARTFDELRESCDDVFVVGLSMGGGLSLRLAADRGDQVAGVVLVNPAIDTARQDVKLLPLLKHVVPAFPAIANDIKKSGVDESGYPVTPLRAAASMFAGFASTRADLGAITAPVLMFRSREDHVVDETTSRAMHAALGAREFTERILENSYHVATLDNDAPLIFAESVEFIARLSAARG